MSAISGAHGRSDDLEAGPLLARVIRFGSISSVVVLFLVSDMVLARLGFSYGDVGGPFFEKLHPATWLAALAAGALLLERGGSRRMADDVCAEPLVLFYLATWACLIAFAMVVAKRPFTPLIDTFFTPLLIYVVIRRSDERVQHHLTVAVHSIMIANAALGIVEYVSGWRLTPLSLGSEIVTYEWRSGALLGHPLQNAAITGCYLVALAVGGGWGLSRRLLPLVIGLELLALAAFGGRSSLVISAGVLGGVGLWRAVAICRGAKVDKLSAAVALMMLPFVIGAVALAVQSGFFDRLIDRFADDQGSANTRLIMLKLFDLIPTADLLLGPDQTYVSALQRVEGIELGIESFWVSFIMQNGLLMSLLFFAGMGAFCLQLVRMTRPASSLPLFVFLVAISASLSLSAKTIMFAQFAALVLTIMRQPLQSEEGAS